MAAISSTSGAQYAVQSGMQQLRLQQAKRNAEQAEQTARALRTQAADAQRVADQAQENAQALSVRSGQAEAFAGQARQGLAMIRSAERMQSRVGGVADAVVEQQTRRSSSPSSAAPVQQNNTQPVVNAQGEVTGTLVNVTA